VFADDANDESTTVEETTGNGTSSDDDSSDDNTTTTTTEIPAVQGEVSLYKTDNTLLATATVGEDGTATFMVTGVTGTVYFNLRYTVDNTTYYISAAKAEETYRTVSSEGSAYQIKANEQASNTSFHYAFGNSSDAYNKFVLDTNAKTISGEAADPSDMFALADQVSLVSSSGLLSGLQSAKQDNKFVFFVENTNIAGEDRSFHASFTVGGTSYNIVATDAENVATENGAAYTVVSSTTSTPDFKLTLTTKYQVMEVTIDLESKTVISKPGNINTDVVLTPSNLTATEANAVDGVYYFDVAGSNTKPYFNFSFTAENGKTYYIYASSSSNRDLTVNGSALPYICYTQDPGSCKFDCYFSTGVTYRVIVDTNNRTVSVVDWKTIATVPSEATVTWVDFDNENTTYAGTLSNNTYSFSNVVFNGDTYFYIKVVDGDNTYYVHANNTVAEADNAPRKAESTAQTTSVSVITDIKPTRDEAFHVNYVGTANVSLSTASEGGYTVTTTVQETSAGVEEVNVEASDVAPVYYNLQGMRVDNPEHGIYIRCRGNKVDKVAL
jgi:hypothetical protein